MSQTMYAIKKVSGNNASSNHTSNTSQNSNKQSSVTSSATSVWQKKKRKRGYKNKSKISKNNNELNDDDNSSNASTNHSQAKESNQENAATDDNNKSSNTSSSSYDPASNPYSLANYKKNPELQKKVENTSKHIKLIEDANANTADNNNDTNANGTNTNNKDQEKELTNNSSTKDNTLPINSTKPQNMSTAPTTNANTSIINNTKSPMSQVRLTPLFPTPPSHAHGIGNGYNNGHGRLPPSFPPNTMSTTAHQHNAIKHIQYLSSNNGDTDPTQCPHGNLTAEELINIKIRKRNVCYVVGLPIHVATETKLRTQEWFGQFGNIATIAINRNSKSIQANSIPAHITYDNDISALNAINFCNKFIFDDGRKLKATFGTQHYCRWFIAANKKCTNVFCGFRHSWCKPSDIITQKDINDFKAIPAGAYTSRNIENQPLGVRSVSASVHGHHQNMNHHTHTSHHNQNNINVQHHHTVTHGHHSHHGHTQPGAQTVPVYGVANQNINQTHNTAHILGEDDKYLRIGHSLTPSLDTLTTGDTVSTSGVHGGNNAINTTPNIANTNGSGSKTAPVDPIKISADPYTFYLSNSAATPTGPGQPQIATVAPPNIPSIPNIYDSRNVLMKQIMNRNQNLQIENDRLTQQIKILSEMELKNKQEIHRWWTELAQSQQNEKNLKAKYEKMQSDFKSLELKHDSLQIKYLALDEKYKHLLNCKNAAKKKEFESWDSNDVIKWIMNLDKQKYQKYEHDLCQNIATENIDGQCLESLDKGDLHRLGVTDFKDKKDLLQKIKELVTPNES